MVSGSHDSSICVWDAKNGECQHSLRTHTAELVDIVPLGNSVVSGSTYGTICVWDIQSKKFICSLKGQGNTITNLAVLDSGRIAAGFRNGDISVWIPGEDKYLEIEPFDGLSNSSSFITPLPDGRILRIRDNFFASVDEKKMSPQIWDSLLGQYIKSLPQYDGKVTCSCCLSDGRILIGGKKGVCIWNPDVDDKPLWLTGHSKTVTSVAQLKDGRVVSGSDDNTIRVWNASTGECLKVLFSHSKPIKHVIALSDNRFISSSEDCTMRVWNPDTGECLRTIQHHQKADASVIALSDSRVVSFSKEDRRKANSIRLWDVNTGKCLHTIKATGSHFNCITVIMDGSVVGGFSDGTLHVWNPETGECVAILESAEVDLSKIDLSKAVLTEDLARLLWHNGAKISNTDYERWVKPHTRKHIWKKHCHEY